MVKYCGKKCQNKHWHQHKVECEVNFQKQTRLPASRSSSIGPEGCFSFFHPKVKVKERMSLRCPSSLKKTFLLFEKAGGKAAKMPFDRNGNGSDLKPF